MQKLKCVYSLMPSFLHRGGRLWFFLVAASVAGPGSPTCNIVDTVEGLKAACAVMRGVQTLAVDLEACPAPAPGGWRGMDGSGTVTGKGRGMGADQELCLFFGGVNFTPASFLVINVHAASLLG